ncbi:MAG TPA: ATP synthase F1 subunit gamma [Myxococcota bacterium]|nr:ATP synthase F1 subunit gamma [Myxococcota bacterium]
MPSLKDIKRRIVTVRKTQQITRAMRMVAGAKLRRAQSAIEAARPYAEAMRATLREVARAQKDAEHPLLAAHPQARAVEIVVVTSDRGLCGAFNANVLKFAQQVIAARAGRSVTITTAGRKANEFFRKRYPGSMGADYPQQGWVQYAQAARIGQRLAERYASGEIDEAVLVYSEFVSVMSQRAREVRLLPFAVGEEPGEAAALPYEIEPSPAKLLELLVPKALETEIFRALLENQVGEHAARMTAMESATSNTEELIGSLTLKYNRARQAAITKELVEIVSGAEAL